MGQHIDIHHVIEYHINHLIRNKQNYNVKNAGSVKKILNEGIDNNIFQWKRSFKLVTGKMNEKEKI